MKCAAPQDAARAPRVAVIDMARVSAESQLGKSYAAQLEKLQNDINAEATKKQTELGKLDTALKTLQEELEKQGAVLSPEARDKKQQDIVRKTRERQAFLEDGQQEINRMRERAQQQAQQINGEFQQKVRPLVEEVAKDKGIDLVLDSQVAYTINRDFDITRIWSAVSARCCSNWGQSCPAKITCFSRTPSCSSAAFSRTGRERRLS